MSACSAAKTKPSASGAIASVENPSAQASAGNAAPTTQQVMPGSGSEPTDVTQPPATRDADCGQEGCGCSEPGTTRACWTGPAAQRGAGKCHDGTQTCNAQGAEFITWGACEGQELDCGISDAGTPPACGCIPGSVVGCDEDCNANIFCSATAEKTCLPDGSWGACRETTDAGLAQSTVTSLFGDAGIAAVVGIDNPGICASNGLTLSGLAVNIPCRNMYHGCCTANIEGTYVGDCDRLFVCGHAPEFK